MKETSNGFKEQPYKFLSNMTLCQVTMYGITYPSVENAYQASKCANKADREQFLNIDPYQAKKLGRMVKVREDFEQMKLQFMYKLLQRKFSPENPELRIKLIATAEVNLVEYNTWGDTFWGVCNGVGQNHLGRLLMKVREEIFSQSRAVAQQILQEKQKPYQPTQAPRLLPKIA